MNTMDETERAELTADRDYWKMRALNAEQTASNLIKENAHLVPPPGELAELFAKHAISDPAMFERRSYKIMLEAVYMTLKSAASIAPRSTIPDMVNVLHAVTSNVSKTLSRFNQGAYSVRPLENDSTSTQTEQSNDQTPRT